ncbi:MAG: imidazole glycerol phosphate synthase subunit HisH [Pyrinomonadaceae bacterium]
MTVAILKYNAGNVASVQNALGRPGVDSVITDDPEVIRAADKLIFPGVGEASTAMSFLCERGLDVLIRSLTQPVLGVCLGMQLMCTHSDENDTPCIGIFPATVRLFESGEMKVPHTGWNTIEDSSPALFHGVPENSYVYFVHSYYVSLSEYTSSVCRYGIEFSAALEKDNFYGVQFHPEKSGTVGEKILENFLRI